MVILPIDPVSGKGWKSSDASHLVNKTDDELRKGLEDISYLYEEVVKDTRYPASHYTLMSDRFNGLVHVLETSAKHFTYSAETTQTLTLNQTPSYYMGFFDPTFAMVAGNPDTYFSQIFDLYPALCWIYLCLLKGKSKCDVRDIHRSTI